MWKYDKRFMTAPEVALEVPLIDEPPAFQEGKWKFIEGPPVTRDVHDAITQMVRQMNAGIRTLPKLKAVGAAARRLRRLRRWTRQLH